MSIIDTKRLFYIDSHNRISGTHSNFTIQLDVGLDTYDQAVVLQINIPKSYYLVQSGQNTITLQEGMTQATISMPIGNYSRTSFGVQLQTLLNSGSPNSWTYTVSIPNTAVTADTGFFLYSVSGNSSQPSFIIGNYLYEQLGLNSNTTYTFSANSLSSINVVKFQPKDTLYIHSNLCSNGIDNVLQEIFGVTAPSYGSLVFETPSLEGYAKDIITPKNNIYQFYLTDEDDNPIDLNGQNMVFTLLMFKKQDVYQLAKQFMKLFLLSN